MRNVMDACNPTKQSAVEPEVRGLSSRWSETTAGRLAWLGLLLMLSLAASGRLDADTEQPRVVLGPWAAGLKVGPKMVVGRVRLWGSQFVGQDLRGANFDDCDLTNVVFRQCDLTGASFRRSVMTGMGLDECTLADNDLSDAVINGLLAGSVSNSPVWSVRQLKSTLSYKRKDLSDCRLRFGDVSPVDLSQLDFTGFKLVGTQFAFADLTSVSFRDAKIYSPGFVQCRVRMRGIQQAEALTLRDSIFVNVEFTDTADFSNQALTRAEILGPFGKTSIENADIALASVGPWLTAEMLSSSRSFREGLLSGVMFNKCDLSNVDFSRQCLIGCSFIACNLANANFEEAVIPRLTSRIAMPV